MRLTSLAVLFLSFFPTIASAQVGNFADDIQRICGPILNASITSATNIDSSTYEHSSMVEFLCSSSYVSKSAARNAGLDIDAVYDGVKIGALYSEDATERSIARTRLCSGSSSTNDLAFKTMIKQINRDPNAYQQYTSCVSSVSGTKNDFFCSITSSPNTPKKAFANIVYQPSTRRVGKLSFALLKGGHIVGDGGTTIPLSEMIKYKQEQPYDPNVPLSAFTLNNLEIELDTLDGASLTIALDDGNGCNPQLNPIPAKVSIVISAIGTSLSKTQQQFIYQFDEQKDCESGETNYRYQKNLEESQFIIDDQNYIDHIFVENSRCPRGNSRITDVKKIDDHSFEYSAQLRGCGYDRGGIGGLASYAICRGSGQLTARGYVLYRSTDATRPPTIDTPYDRYYYDGRIPLSQFRYSTSVPNDFHLDGMAFEAEVRIPKIVQGVISYRNFRLAQRTMDANYGSQCQEWQEPDGHMASITASFTKGDVVTIAQLENSCAESKVELQRIVGRVGSVMPDEICSNYLDGLPKLPEGSDPNVPDPGALFGPGAKCTR